MRARESTRREGEDLITVMHASEIQGGESRFAPRTSLGIILAAGFMLRLALLIVNLEVATLPQGGGDAGGFERRAWELSHAPAGDRSISAGALVLLGSYVYSATGRQPYVLGLIMVGLGTLIIQVGYRAALELWESVRVARVVAWGLALFPMLALHSALFLREIPVSLCLAGAALSAIRLIKHGRVASIFAYCLWAAVGALFHSAVIIAIPALLLGMLFARSKRERHKGRYYVVRAAAIVVLAGVLYLLSQTGFGLDEFGGSFEEGISAFQQRELRETAGTAAFPEWMRVRGGVAESWKIPIRAVALVFSPLLPFMVRTPQHTLGLIDAALYLYMFWTLFRYRRILRAHPAGLTLLGVAVILLLVYALGVSNFGTAIRHRAKVAPVLILLAAGLPELRRLIMAKRRAAASLNVDASTQLRRA